MSNKSINHIAKHKIVKAILKEWEGYYNSKHINTRFWKDVFYSKHFRRELYYQEIYACYRIYYETGEIPNCELDTPEPIMGVYTFKHHFDYDERLAWNDMPHCYDKIWLEEYELPLSLILDTEWAMYNLYKE